MVRLFNGAVRKMPVRKNSFSCFESNFCWMELPQFEKGKKKSKKEICPKIAIQLGKLHCNCTIGTRYIWQ